ncbi:MAG: 3-deoxy-manno-octulosonate cytidylyltransferase [Bacteroidales bacterium]|nr:3-deoxy-manno-octulosonate cytidylyltransferase [Bacteroidales bacterium]
MAFIGVIPARYASTRFPGKPLALIHGKPMVQWVFERACQAGLQRVVVATDDERIRSAVEQFGGQAVMTSPHHQSGTERCAEVAESLCLADDDVVINIQGDEPYIRPEAINLLASQFQNPHVGIATLAKEFLSEENPQNPNMVKVVCSQSGRALYFSRSAIPYFRNQEVAPRFFKHIGIYAYRYEILKKIVKLPVSTLENAEKLEQLRWLDNDFEIYVRTCDYESIAIDTPEDLERAEKVTVF